MENENEILGFDPSQLSVFNEPEAPKSTGSNLIYRTRPADSKDEDHIYRSTIKIVYNPFNTRDSILEQQAYWLEDAEGGFSVTSSLTINDTSCPIFKAWKKCHFTKKEDNEALWAQAAPEKDEKGNYIGGHNVFDKRFTRYCVVQILEDKNQPQLVNKYMLWKLPKSIWEMLTTKTKPTSKEKAARPVMDFLFGNSIDLEVSPGPGKPGDSRYSRETSYRGEWSEDYVTCKAVDGSEILNAEEKRVLDTYVSEMKEVWKNKDEDARKAMTAEINTHDNTKKLREIYSRVLAEIKEVCPNLIEVLGYKPWDEATTKRVDEWIKVVLSGNNPKTVNNAPATIQNAVTPEGPVPEFVNTAPAASAASAAPDDDLPF